MLQSPLCSPAANCSPLERKLESALSPTRIILSAAVWRIFHSNWSESSVSGWGPRPDRCCSRAAEPARPIRGVPSPARPALVPAPRADACPAQRRSSCTAARNTPLIKHLQTPPHYLGMQAGHMPSPCGLTIVEDLTAAGNLNNAMDFSAMWCQTREAFTMGVNYSTGACSMYLNVTGRICP